MYISPVFTCRVTNVLLQDLRQVDGAHKTVQLQTNALTRPETGRRSIQNKYKQMLLQDPRQVDGAHKTVQLQTNALTRPEIG